MAKLTLTNITSGHLGTSTFNTNNDLIEAALENTLSRDGTSPNTMSAPLDMNSQRITNLPTAVNNTEPVILSQANILAGVTNPLTQNSVGAVLWPATAAETAAAVTPTNLYYEPGDVRRYGADDTGSTNSASAIATALSVGIPVDFGSGTYLIESTIALTGGMTITATDCTILKNFDGVGITITGGASYNYVIGNFSVQGNGSFASDTSGASGSATAHGVTVTSNRLIVKGLLDSRNHEGSGFVFNSAATNSNHTVLSQCRANYNGVHGFHFQGTNDNCSVWKVELEAFANRKSGLFFDTDYAGRNWEGEFYSEANCIDTTSVEIDIGKLRVSLLSIYAENSTYAEVVLRANCVGLDIYSMRRNLDYDYTTAGDNRWRYGNQIYHPGRVGDSRQSTVNTFYSLRARAANPTEYVQNKYQGNASTVFGYTRATGGESGVSPEMMLVSADGSTELGVDDDKAFTNKGFRHRNPTEDVTTTNVITAAESGTTFYLNSAGGFTSTLPTPAAGLKYTFIVKTAPTTAYIIVSESATNILYGTYLDIVGELVPIIAQDTFNFVANTALRGDRLEVESDGTYWYCKAFSAADGGITTSAT